MDIIEKAKELGTMIAESKEMEAYNQAEEKMQNDPQALALLTEYQEIQIEMVNATKEGKEAGEIEKIKERLIIKDEEINTYETTKGFIAAKADFDRLMHTVNDVIVHAITGEESCSGSCSSCGGGCK